MTGTQDPETRGVTLDELRSGVKLEAGRSYLLVMGARAPRATGEEPPSTEPQTPDAVRAAFDAAHFETDKAFPLKDALPTFRRVAGYANRNPDRTMVVIGHTDTVGDHAANLLLSRERARSIQAYLHDDVQAWMDEFYGHADTAKRWGAHEDQLMLMALPFDATAYLASGTSLREAIRKFQTDAGISPQTGEMDAATRRALVLAYMKAEGTSVPEGMKSESIGASFDHLEEQTGPDVDRPANRRVDVFFFRDAPSPAASECRDHHDNDQLPCPVYAAWRKNAKDLGPDADGHIVRLLLLDDAGNPVPRGTAYRLTSAGQMREGVVGEGGLLEEKDFVTEGAEVTVEWVGVVPATMVAPPAAEHAL